MQGLSRTVTSRRMGPQSSSWRRARAAQRASSCIAKPSVCPEAETGSYGLWTALYSRSTRQGRSRCVWRRTAPRSGCRSPIACFHLGSAERCSTWLLPARSTACYALNPAPAARRRRAGSAREPPYPGYFIHPSLFQSASLRPHQIALAPVLARLLRIGSTTMVRTLCWLRQSPVLAIVLIRATACNLSSHRMGTVAKTGLPASLPAP